MAGTYQQDPISQMTPQDPTCLSRVLFSFDAQIQIATRPSGVRVRALVCVWCVCVSLCMYEAYIHLLKYIQLHATYLSMYPTYT